MRDDLTEEQIVARVRRRTQRHLRRLINDHRDPEFMKRLQKRLEEDRAILDKLRDGD